MDGFAKKLDSGVQHNRPESSWPIFKRTPFWTGTQRKNPRRRMHLALKRFKWTQWRAFSAINLFGIPIISAKNRNGGQSGLDKKLRYFWVQRT